MQGNLHPHGKHSLSTGWLFFVGQAFQTATIVVAVQALSKACPAIL